MVLHFLVLNCMKHDVSLNLIVHYMGSLRKRNCLTVSWSYYAGQACGGMIQRPIFRAEKRLSQCFLKVHFPYVGTIYFSTLLPGPSSEPISGYKVYGGLANASLTSAIIQPLT